MRKKEKTGILIFVFLILLLPIIVIFLIPRKQVYRGRANGPEGSPTFPLISNLYGKGATVSWISKNPLNVNLPVETNGSVLYGADQNNLDKRAFDVRGADNISAMHYVNIKDLAPNTNYYFLIKSGPESDTYGKDPLSKDRVVRGGAVLPFKTGPDLSPSSNRTPIFGYVKNNAGDKLSDTLVVAIVAGNNFSSFLSSLTNQVGGWAMDLANARTEDLNTLLSFTPTDKVALAALAPTEAGHSISIPIRDAMPAPDILVGDKVFFKLAVGWNVITIYREPKATLVVQSLIVNVKSTGGEVIEVDRWTNGAWESFVPGGYSQNFTLEYKRAYYLKVTKEGVFSYDIK